MNFIETDSFDELDEDEMDALNIFNKKRDSTINTSKIDSNWMIYYLKK